MIDNNELNAVMEKLESLSDETLAVELLKEFNEKTKKMGTLLMNKDPNLDHEEWKSLCDVAQKEVNDLVEKIMGL